jgi:hypothetical protein
MEAFHRPKGSGSGRIPLLKGEGAAKRRVRGKEKEILYPSPGASHHPLPSGEGFVQNFSAFTTADLITISDL